MNIFKRHIIRNNLRCNVFLDKDNSFNCTNYLILINIDSDKVIFVRD